MEESREGFSNNLHPIFFHIFFRATAISPASARNILAVGFVHWYAYYGPTTGRFALFWGKFPAMEAQGSTQRIFLSQPFSVVPLYRWLLSHVFHGCLEFSRLSGAFEREILSRATQVRSRPDSDPQLPAAEY